MRDLSEKYFPIIRKLEDSGLTMQAFSKQEGIHIKTLHYWKRKYRELSLPVARQRLPSNAASHTNTKEKQPGFARLNLSGHEQPEVITIHYSDGMRISFPIACEAALVKQFIPAFST
jgi:hypothetical protein